MRKIVNIILGWWFWITNRNNELARKRLAKCSMCYFRNGMTCGICHCVLQAKARIEEEECPKGKWPVGDKKLKSMLQDFKTKFERENPHLKITIHS